MTTNLMLRRTLRCVTFLLPLVLVATGAQAQAAKPANCNVWRLDEAKNRILFNDPKVNIQMPDKEERAKLRAQGQPGQLFVMKNCNTPDFEGTVPVFSEAESAGNAVELVPSMVRVIILGEKGKWLQVKGHTELWKGTGWVRITDDLVVVKY
ncbi:MAG TPA: hypothetical protein VNN18_03485 [Candidatus Xenobia bacterium]|nr:hypothetical protein [Candidatus Xenobia bacterium]